MKSLVIVTGSPGADLEHYAATAYPQATIYSDKCGNKQFFRYHKEADGLAVFCTPSPTKKSKQYWLETARRFGFSPRLVCLTLSREQSYQQYVKGTTDEAARVRMKGHVARWFKNYSRHEEEVSVDGRQSVPQAKVG